LDSQIQRRANTTRPGNPSESEGACSQIVIDALGTRSKLGERPLCRPDDIAVFPWCLTPELYAAKPDYIKSLADFVRSRPAQSVASLMQQSSAVIAHDAEAQLSRITAPTLITFGRHDLATSTRFVERMKGTIRNSELLIFEGCAHAPIYENVEEFNNKTVQFLKRHAG
jgi:pimeloyl-ACP methyl ester carboxylesterase